MSDAPVDKTVPSGQISRESGSAGGATADAAAATSSEPAAPRPFDALSYLEFNAARTPDAPAVWDENREQSFTALRDRVWALIARLIHDGIGPGDVVAVALPNVALYVALEIAVPASGAVLFPLPLGIGHRELASVLQRSGARLARDRRLAGRGGDRGGRGRPPRRAGIARRGRPR